MIESSEVQTKEGFKAAVYSYNTCLTCVCVNSKSVAADMCKIVPFNLPTRLTEHASVHAVSQLYLCTTLQRLTNFAEYLGLIKQSSHAGCPAQNQLLECIPVSACARQSQYECYFSRYIQGQWAEAAVERLKQTRHNYHQFSCVLVRQYLGITQ